MDRGFNWTSSLNPSRKIQLALFLDQVLVVCEWEVPRTLEKAHRKIIMAEMHIGLPASSQHCRCEGREATHLDLEDACHLRLPARLGEGDRPLRPPPPIPAAQNTCAALNDSVKYSAKVFLGGE